MKAQALTAETARFANFNLFTDVMPYEVIKVVSPKCLEVREMDAEETKESIEKRQASFVQGGFVGHTDNSVQEWTITSNPTNAAVRIRQHKDGNWFGKCGERFILSDKPEKFYDFNF